ncbi:transposase, partial [Salinimicrobium sp. CDJ15-91]
MADLYKNRYRIKSTRLENWDYRWNAAYFITICTADRKHYFGEIKNGKMEFSPVGVIADILWHEIIHHTSHVLLGNFVVMPNHIHGILILDNP